MPHPRHVRQGAILGSGIALLLAVSACSSSGGSSTPSASGATSGSSTANAASVLGTPNKATGTPITVGLVGDGDTPGVAGQSATDGALASIAYANDYLGGLDGHVMKADVCLTKNTPSGGTACGVQMVKDKVAVVLSPVSAQDGAIFTAMKGSGIPFASYTSANSAILLGADAYNYSNPIGLIGATAEIAKEKGTPSVAMVIIDVPAATGPISLIATPAFAKAGVKLNIVKVSPTVADMTPQLQQAISTGAKYFAVTGTEAFNVTAIKGLKQLGFTGPIQANLNSPSAESVASIPGGLEGVISVQTLTTDPADPDMKLFNAVLDTYAKNTKHDGEAQYGFADVISTVRALQGTTATDAKSINTALSTMPKAVAAPLGAGLTFQCGAKLVPLTPAVCGAGALQSVMDKDGVQHDYKPVPGS